MSGQRNATRILGVRFVIRQEDVAVETLA